MLALLVTISLLPCLPGDGAPDNVCLQTAIDAAGDQVLDVPPGVWEVGPPAPDAGGVLRNRWASIIIPRGGLRGGVLRMVGDSGGHDWMMIWLTGPAVVERMVLDGSGRTGGLNEHQHLVLVSGSGAHLLANDYYHPEIGPGGDCIVLMHALNTVIESSIAECDRSFVLIQRGTHDIRISGAQVTGGGDQDIDQEASGLTMADPVTGALVPIPGLAPSGITIEDVEVIRRPGNLTASLTLGPGSGYRVRRSTFGPILLGNALDVVLEGVDVTAAGAKRCVYQVGGSARIVGGRFLNASANACLVSRLGEMTVERALVIQATQGQAVRGEGAVVLVTDSTLLYTGTSDHRDALATALDPRGALAPSLLSVRNRLRGAWRGSAGGPVLEVALRGVIP